MSSSRQPDPYAILGVDPAATAEQITHAYRDLLRRHHPDTRPATPDIHDQAPTDDARLQQVIHAYAVLRDPAQRAGYDRGRSPSPPTRLDQRHRTAPPPAGTVVIGIIDQPSPPLISPLQTRTAGPNVPTEAVPDDRLERIALELFLRYLFYRPR
jgi:curved DNA-binding protein CbpA